MREREIALSRLCPPNRAITYGIVQPGKPHDQGIPIVRVNNFRGHRMDLSERLCVAPDVEAAYVRSRPQENDVLITLVGSIGQVAIAPKSIAGWNLARAVGLIPTPDRHHAEWIFYTLQSPNAQNYIRKYANTTVQATFNLKDLANFPIPYPNASQRERILEVLSSLDQKIELNRRMNETLEAMAQAIFRDWFVDFGPTRRKLKGAIDPVTILGGLVQDAERAQALADHFPATLVDDELPEGWGETNLESYAVLNPESWGAKSAPDQVEYVDLANTKWGTIESTTFYAWKEAPSRAKRVIRNGDTIVGTVRPGNGSYAFVGRDGLTASTGFAVLRPKQPEFAEFVNCAATKHENIERLEKLADGGAYPAVKPEAVLATATPQVPMQAVLAFSGVTASMFQRIELSKRESRTLSDTRDLLLARLISGEIRLGDADEVAA